MRSRIAVVLFFPSSRSAALATCRPFCIWPGTVTVMMCSVTVAGVITGFPA